jgi:hypothetical protein
VTQNFLGKGSLSNTLLTLMGLTLEVMQLDLIEILQLLAKKVV